jgi:hypothetical protein
LSVISVLVGALSTISTGFLQQVIAHPKGLIENIHEHFNCDVFGNCDEFARGGTINGPDIHINCNQIPIETIKIIRVI